MIFKIIFILRKKVQGFWLWYLKNETRALFNSRIQLPKDFGGDTFPNFVLDHTSSTITIGPGTSFRGRFSLLSYKDGKLSIEGNTFFNNNCSINCFDSVKIGSNCLFGENVKVYDHNHCYKNKELLIKDQGYSSAPVNIGDNCWIGSDVTILKGVTIGDNSVIGAGCLIFKDIPANSIVKNNLSVKVTNY